MEVFVGIDVSKDQLAVHVLPSGEALRVECDAESLAGLCRRLSALEPMAVAMEATGGSR